MNLWYLALLGPSQIGPLLGLIASGYGFYRLLPALRPGWQRGVAVSALILAFAVLKRYSFLTPLLPAKLVYTTLGMSYILFRILHLGIDAASGALPRNISPLAYLRYVAYFPALASGPVQRFDGFEAALAAAPPKLGSDNLVSALTRILRGYFRCLVLGGGALWLHKLLTERNDLAGAAYGFACTAYMLHLYLNFSGYIDVVLGLSRLFGVVLPENFDRPFAARSFLELWSRWHITMSQWFKAYVFNPFVRALARRWPNRKLMPYLGALGYLLTFFVMGLWHGTTPGFVVYGLVLGLGACGNKLYEVVLRGRLSRPAYAALTAHPCYRAVAGGLCFGYYSMGLAFFWQSYAGWSQTVTGLGLRGVATAFAAAFVGSLLVIAGSALFHAAGKLLATSADAQSLLKGSPT